MAWIAILLIVAMIFVPVSVSGNNPAINASLATRSHISEMPQLAYIPVALSDALSCDELLFSVQAANRLLEIVAHLGLDMGSYQPAVWTKVAFKQSIQIRCPQLINYFRPAPAVKGASPAVSVLGYSTKGRSIKVYTFGNGPLRVALVGGIHGGYEWNTILLAYQSIDFFTKYPEKLPAALSLHIIPVANPDGQAAVLGHAGRFAAAELPEDTTVGRLNSNQVDLNRNWACEWSPDAFWGEQEVSAGRAPFSERESKYLRDFFVVPPMDVVLFWHSAVPGVFPGNCGKRHASSNRMAAVYAKAADYPFGMPFDAYEVTGDASNWLASQGVPAFIVELTTHTDTDWKQNVSGLLALFQYLDTGQNSTAVP